MNIIRLFWMVYSAFFFSICIMIAADLWNTILDRPDIPTGKPPWLP